MLESINMSSQLKTVVVMIFSILVISSIIIKTLTIVKPEKNWEELTQRIKSWWIMAFLFIMAVVFNKKISLLFFTLMSFWAFKEYITIMGTRRSDHKTLFFAFLVVPIQFYWAWIEWYGMFIIFIPVYVFLFLPIVQVISQDTKNFLSATSRIQWGLMAFVFGLSHMGYLLTLPTLQNGIIKGQLLLLFLVIVTELNDVLQFLWGKSLGKRKILSIVSPNKTWAGFLGGALTSGVVSLAIRFLTPFSVKECFIIAIILAVAGFCGDVVMSAVKRDLQIKDFGEVIPGHGGVLDRVDSLCYTAPLFFHIVYYLYY